MTSPNRAPAPGRWLPDTRVPVFVRASAPAAAQAPATSQRSPQPAARPAGRSPLAEFAAQQGLDAAGVVQLVERLTAQASTRRLAQDTQAENAAAADRIYDACFGPGAAAADTARLRGTRRC